jgi:CDP-diacylglycerol--serine O-phosphatidyltransferase
MKTQPSRRYYRRKGQRINTLKRGVYILPNFLTSLSLFFGFYSIVSTMKGNFVWAAWTIVIAGLFDGLDGRIARMTHTTTKFGVEYDSLCDLVAFGVAPAVLAYGLVLNQYGRWGWLAAFLYVACGAIRLARFNTLTGVVKSIFFQGLPIPAAAGMVASTVLFCFHFNIVDKKLLSIFLLLTIYVLAFLMVSTIRFKSFKELDLGTRKPFSAGIVAILLICIIASEPQIMLFSIGLIYIFFGLLGYFMYIVRKKRMQINNKIKPEDKDDWEKTKG